MVALWQYHGTLKSCNVFIILVQEKVELLNERLEGSVADKSENQDVTDGTMHGVKSAMKKCMYANTLKHHIKVQSLPLNSSKDIN